MGPKVYTTAQAAAKIGVSRQTLHAWIEADRIVAPKPIELGQRPVRLWTEADIQKARKYKGTLKRGPKPKK
jgi:predicted DNA-binding transcriptional regulator AlpA